jgi:hypothetical protein
MKMPGGSRGRFSIGIALLFAILAISGGCSKSTEGMTPSAVSPGPNQALTDPE